MDDYVEQVLEPAPAAPPPSHAGAPPSGQQDALPWFIGIAARPQGGRWQIVAQGFDTRADAERYARPLRGRFPELELRVVVVGFPEELRDQLPKEGDPIWLGAVVGDLMGSIATLHGLMDLEARTMTPSQLRARRERLGLRVVRDTGGS